MLLTAMRILALIAANPTCEVHGVNKLDNSAYIECEHYDMNVGDEPYTEFSATLSRAWVAGDCDKWSEEETSAQWKLCALK